MPPPQFFQLLMLVAKVTGYVRGYPFVLRDSATVLTLFYFGASLWLYNPTTYHLRYLKGKSKANSQGRLITTYGEEFRWKRLSSPAKITKPFPCILIPNQKMSNETNNRKDYKPSKMTDQIDCREKIVKHKNNIACSNDKFEGKSETKSAYKFPVPKKVFGLNGDSAKRLANATSSN
ncbi:uncharacterized protein CEXT_687541 [Caerostris extrusa]|uniref:Uncharacterized protein n=1 Tax=Caerostris extrusa TaxID=172846 RepID=A0AAV4T0L6_CAEEX|nr:uncharacterized protein CEXT_687541 [Caerostris extrusa]